MLREVEVEVLDETGEADSYLVEGDLQSGDLIAVDPDDDFYSGQAAELLEVIDW